MPALSIIGIISFGLIVYSNTFLNSFHFDDFPQIVNNHAIRNIWDIAAIWHCYPARFMAFLSFALNYHWGGLHVLGFHILSLIIHVGASLLAWQLALLTLHSPSMRNERISLHAPWIAFFTGMIFLVHPLQTQPINYIYQRAALLAAFFYLGALILYIKARLGTGLPHWKFYYAASFLTALLSICSKETTITLPFMVCFYESCFLKGTERFKWNMVMPFFLVYVLLFMAWHEPLNLTGIKSMMQGTGVTIGQYFLTQLKVLVTYIRLIFLPIHQTVEYDYPLSKSIFELPVILSALFLLGINLMAVNIFNKYRLMAFGILWFFITLMPESSFWPNQDLIFEHRLYLPMFGFGIFLSSGLFYIIRGHTSNLAIRLLFLIVMGYSVLSYQRNKVWHDEMSLWDDAVRQSPRSAMAYLNRGAAYQKRGDLLHAMEDYNMVIGLGPVTSVTLSNRGAIFEQEGDYAHALANFNLAIKLNPSYTGSYVNRGLLYMHEGKPDLALADLNKAIDAMPNDSLAYMVRGQVEEQIGNFQKAHADFKKGENLKNSSGF